MPVKGCLIDGGEAGLAEACVRGMAGAGGVVEVASPGDTGLAELALSSEVLVIAAPVVLGGLPGAVKTWLDSLLLIEPASRRTARTARLRAGYLATYPADDPDLRELFHKHVRAIFDAFGMTYVGCALGHVAPGARPNAALLAAAERLGAALVQGASRAGWPEEYLAGIRRFNAREFWEAHEAWEELWLEAPEEDRLYFQGLIQVAAAFHHLGRGNWGGMDSLLRQAAVRLEGYLPAMRGLDVDAFLLELEPWRGLAAARAGGKLPKVLRVPAEPPVLVLEEPGGTAG